MVTDKIFWSRKSSMPLIKKNNNSNNNSNNNNNNNNDEKSIKNMSSESDAETETVSDSKSKVIARGVLMCRDNSHPFQDRVVTLDKPVKIGRSVARAKATTNNAIFDCKVLSRNHALLWYKGGKFYLQDTKSSNGTFVNNHRLSATGEESGPREVCSGDIVQFGVNVIENTKNVQHGCIIATLKLYLPDGKEAKASNSVACPASVSLEDLYKLNYLLQEANRREKALRSKLTLLQRLVENTREAAGRSWKAFIDEDRLISRIETMESYLVTYSKNFTEDKLRQAVIQLQEENAQYQNVAKEALQKLLQEKLEVTQKLVQLESRLNETEEECQSLHEVAKHNQTELQELASRYTEAQKKLGEMTNKLFESEDVTREIIEKMEIEREYLLRRLKSKMSAEKNLQARLRDSRLDSVYVHKQITALKNYMQTLQDMNSKLISSPDLENVEGNKQLPTGPNANPIEMINATLNKLNSMVEEKELLNDEGENDEIITLPPSDNTYVTEESENDIRSMEMLRMKIEASHLEFIDSYLTGKIEVNEVKDRHPFRVTSIVNNTEYIVPPSPSKDKTRKLLNGDVVDKTVDFDKSNDNATMNEECRSSDITDNNIQDNSVIENKKEEMLAMSYQKDNTEMSLSKSELTVNDEQTEKTEGTNEKNQDPLTELKQDEEPLSEVDNVMATNIATEQRQQISSDEIHDYGRTLKPSPNKIDTANSRTCLLLTSLGGLDSLQKRSTEVSEVDQQLIARELEDLKQWLLREPNQIVMEKLKELYCRIEDETRRSIQVEEELANIKNKCKLLNEEKEVLEQKYTNLKNQCGDLLNATYTVPIQYVAPIAIALLWMLLEKIF